MNISNLFKAALPHLISIAAFIVVSCLFFAPQFQGKVLQQSDIVSWEAASREILDYKEKNGEQLLWTNSMFGGMPAYQVAMQFKGMFLTKLQAILSVGISGPAGVFLAMMVSFYFLMIFIGVNTWLALFSAIGYGLATNNLVLLEAGHSNKLNALVFFPIIFLGLYDLFFKRQYFIGAVVLALGAGANLAANHIQMTYYFLLCVGLLVVVWIVKIITEQAWSVLMKVFVSSVVAAIFAFASAISIYWPTYEYSEATMRGKAILQTEKDNSGAQEAKPNGLGWDYAMQWSNGFQDLAAIIIPRAAGGSSSERVKSGAAYSALRASGYRLESDGAIRLPLYWGNLPFTSGPSYLGAVFCLLFVIGLVLVRDYFKWWMGLSVLLTVLLSMGSNFEGFQRLFFDYLPLYSKFRAPSSILTITICFLPVLGMLAVSKIIKGEYTQREVSRALWIGSGITGLVCLFFALTGRSMFDFSSAGDAGIQKELMDLLRQDRADFLVKDAWRSFFLITFATGLLFGYIQKWYSPTTLIVGLGLLIGIDIWGVGRRYFGPGNFVTKNDYQNQFQPRPVDQQILSLENRRGDYRVLDLSVNTFNSNVTSYLHNSVGGYSAAKMQRYQDLIDLHIAKGNQSVLDMLNTKYIISQDQQLQTNPNALGTAWFVDSVIIVNSPNEEIQALNNFDPANNAVVLDQEFDNYVGGFNPVKGGTIRLKDYDPMHMVYEVNVPSAQMAVFSEIWYGPDKGWTAKIDGKEAKHIRANYVLRALKIPEGRHTIEFVFSPDSVKGGMLVSSISSSLIWLLFIGIIGFNVRIWAKNNPVPEPIAPRMSSAPGSGSPQAKKGMSQGNAKKKKK